MRGNGTRKTLLCLALLSPTASVPQVLVLWASRGWFWVILGDITHLFPKSTRISLHKTVMTLMLPVSPHHCSGGLGRCLQGDYCQRVEWRSLTRQCGVTDHLQVLWDLGIIPTVSGALPVRGLCPLHKGSILCSCNVTILSFLLNNNLLQVFKICSQGGTKNSSFFPSPQVLFSREVFLFSPWS